MTRGLFCQINPELSQNNAYCTSDSSMSFIAFRTIEGRFTWRSCCFCCKSKFR